MPIIPVSYVRAITMQLDTLSAQAISASLPDPCFDIIIKDCLPSTNDYLMVKLKTNAFLTPKTVVLAEIQTNGKGQHGRAWVSPPGNILMSLYWPFKCNLESLYGLSLVVGIAVARVLQAQGLHDVQLKWPNDIYWEGHKMGGILIETKQNKPGIIGAIIGLGLNIIDLADYRREINRKVVALENALGCKVSRNKLVADLLDQLNIVLTQFAHVGFDGFVAEWKALDVLTTGEMAERLKAHVSKT